MPIQCSPVTPAQPIRVSNTCNGRWTSCIGIPEAEGSRSAGASDRDGSVSSRLHLGRIKNCALR